MTYFDQHFMVDIDLIERIVEYADLKENEKVIEIGPGSGNLTRFLARKVKIEAFEMDNAFIDELEKIKNVKVVKGNALELLPREFDKLVSNIPYSISEPLIKKLMHCDFKLAILTVSKSFADILIRDETKIGLISKYFFEIKILEEVPPSSFSPLPKVVSAIVEIKPNETESKAIKELLLQEDKKVANAIRETLCKLKNKTKNEIKAILLKFHVPDKTVDSLSFNETKRILEWIKTF